MTDTQVPAPPPTDAQLHGKACITCNRGDGPLVPAGHVYTGVTGTYGWPVVACPEHAPKETTQ